MGLKKFSASCWLLQDLTLSEELKRSPPVILAEIQRICMWAGRVLSAQTYILKLSLRVFLEDVL